MLGTGLKIQSHVQVNEEFKHEPAEARSQVAIGNICDIVKIYFSDILTESRRRNAIRSAIQILKPPFSPSQPFCSQ